MSVKQTYILDFEPPNDFVIILDKETVTGVHRFKNIIINDIALDDNIRLITNKGFLIEILKRKESQEFMFRLIIVNVLKPNRNPPTGFSDNYDEFIEILNNIIS